MPFAKKNFWTLSLQILLLWGITGCYPPQSGQPGSTQIPGTTGEFVGALEEAAREFQEMTKPNRVKSWVQNLKVKAHPGKDYQQIAMMKEGEIAEYLYQRTMRKESYEFRNQQYNEPWLLIKTKDGLIGWVHGGGVIFAQPDFTQLFNQPASPAEEQLPEEDPSFTQRMRAPNPSAPVSPPPTMDPKEREKYDFLVVPGSRVGPIHLTTSEDDLIRLYGPQVSRGTVQKMPDESVPCTILMAGSNDEVRITWTDENRSQVKGVYLTKSSGRWHMAEGVQVGMSLLDLTKVNQAPISFYGFGWEYSGTVESYLKGTLNKYQKQFYLVLSPGRVNERFKQYQSSKTFSSQETGVAPLDLYVSRMVVYLD